MLYIPTCTTPLREALTYYVNTISVAKKSYQTEIYRIRPLQEHLGDLTLPEIERGHCVAYRDLRLASPHPRKPGCTLGPATVKLELMLLSHVFTMAISEWGMEDLSNPIEKLRKPKSPPGRVRRLTRAEERKLLPAARRHSNPEMYAIIVLALETACRQGELLAMTWENVSWKKRTVLLPQTKNGEVREVPLSERAQSILREYLSPQPDGKIFGYSAAGFKSSWRMLVQGLRIENLHFHDLRHEAISRLFELGLNTMEVSTISGHKSLAMLKRYAHLVASQIVPKLNPPRRRKAERSILRDQLPSYPAILTIYSRQVIVEFPDLEDLRVRSSRIDEAQALAQALLLQRLVRLLVDGRATPTPSPVGSLQLPSKKSQWVWISPLGEFLDDLSAKQVGNTTIRMAEKNLQTCGYATT
ncbi:site-specific integrase [Chromobacterium piscinae]|uniref:site-specific integrase n=1 Tax=Chromobacterium piscinae TaxID=686831 RepID=UPI001E604308|nr:site-specific integrase [Chromobacterium piscinae]MCD5327847.1 site-specific integrase [Chromobacterium piscinae]